MAIFSRMMRKILLLPLLSGLFGFGIQSGLQVEPAGRQLKEFYFSLDVEHLWIAGSHVNWETGAADKPEATAGNHTHCSAFVAAACKRLNIYILRPPDHGQLLLANAQYDWLASPAALEAGWKPVEGIYPTLYETAQRLANQGYVVVAICKNPDEKVPGHAALVLPENASREKLEDAGPALIMAGTHNHRMITLAAGFKSHLPGWPEHVVKFYCNDRKPF